MSTQPYILIVAADDLSRESLASAMAQAQYPTFSVATFALATMDGTVSGVLMPGQYPAAAVVRADGPLEEVADLLAGLQNVWPALPSIVITATPPTLIPLGLLDHGAHSLILSTSDEQALIAALHLVLTDPYRARQELRLRAELELLRSLGTITASLDRDTLLRGALTQLIASSGAGAGSIYLLDEGQEKLSVAISHWVEEHEPLQSAAHDLGLAYTGEPTVLNEAEVTTLAERAPSLQGMRKLLMLPLRAQEKVWGRIVLAGRHDSDFSPDTVLTLSVACREIAWALARTLAYQGALDHAVAVERLYRFQQNIFEHLPCAVLVFDLEGQICAGNSALEALTGYSQDALHHLNLRGLAPEATDQLLATVRAQERALLQFGVYAQDGRRLDLEMHVSPLCDGDKVTGGLVLLRDLYEVRRTYDPLIRTEKLRALDEMSSGIAHNVNNRLAVILGRAQLAARQVRDEDLRRDLEAIARAAKDSAELIQRLQLATALDGGRRYVGSVDINVLVRDVLKEASPYLLSEAQHGGYEIELVKDLMPVMPVFGNREELRHVLMNMVSNAQEAMPRGGTMTLATRQAGNWVAIRVSDTGIGMSEQVKRRVFDPLFTTKGPKSSGLGLTMAYGIVARHSGDIEVESSVGRGTTFIIRLPSKRLPIAPEWGTLAFGQPGRVLIVDDEQEIVLMLEKLLSAEGYEVTVALSGRSAMALFNQSDYQLVIADLGLPDMPGWEIASAVHETHPEIPVILITGWGVNTSEEDLRKYHIRELIFKPFDTESLLGAVRRALGPVSQE